MIGRLALRLLRGTLRPSVQVTAKSTAQAPHATIWNARMA